MNDFEQLTENYEKLFKNSILLDHDIQNIIENMVND